MAGPSVMVRVLADLAGFSQSANNLGSTAESVASRMHTVFSGVLSSLNQTGVLGPFGAALSGVDAMLGQISEHGKDVGLAMIGVGGAMAGIGAGLTALGSKDQAAHQQLQAAVAATGASYDDYAAQVDAAIRHQEKFGDTADTTQNALAKLTEATHDPQKALDLLSTATDLAAAKHEDLSSAADALGKVYNGNTRLLKAYGIEVDKNTGLTKDGQTATQALAGVLAGQASAATNTFTGHLHALGAEIEDRTAEFGTRFGPAITAAGAALTGLGAAVSVGSTALQAMQAAAVGTRIELALLSTWQTIVTVAQWLWNAAMAANPIMLVVIAVAALVAAIVYLATQTRFFQDIWQAMSAAVVVAWNAVWSFFQTVFRWVANNWPLLLAILTGPIGLAVLFIVDHIRQIENIFATVASAVTATWNAVVAWFAGLPGRIMAALGSFGSLLYNAGRDLIQGLINGIGSLAGAVGDKIKSVVTGPVNEAKHLLGIGSPSTVFAQMGRDTVQGYINGLDAMQGAAAASMASAIPVPDLSGSAAGGSGTGTAAAAGWSGPAVHVENLNLGEPVDVDLFMRKAAWLIQTQKV